ncbi:unnamed protein product [Periconia digitata]|uniref:Uncharacterized protein n=1 Tax=Periconia digitata TaxID=1303443 RepID=A0A9W4U332_9PLEO|nr:unnamed protein product [Periconia digitata]
MENWGKEKSIVGACIYFLDRRRRDSRNLRRFWRDARKKVCRSRTRRARFVAMFANHEE